MKLTAAPYNCSCNILHSLRRVNLSKYLYSINNNGFTLVELLIVVSVVAILSGITMTTLNMGQQRRNAGNAVRKATMEKLVGGIEAYFGAEGMYPANTTDSVLQRYVSNWPTDTPAHTRYNYYVSGSRDTFVLMVPLCDYDGSGALPSTCTREAKYRPDGTGWGKIKECDYQASPNDSTCTNELVY
jgi:prepilin-type N-terminal cleavage/methylation domain-containing protein